MGHRFQKTDISSLLLQCYNIYMFQLLKNEKKVKLFKYGNLACYCLNSHYGFITTLINLSVDNNYQWLK